MTRYVGYKAESCHEDPIFIHSKTQKKKRNSTSAIFFKSTGKEKLMNKMEI